VRTIIVLCTVILAASHNIKYVQDHSIAICVVGLLAFLWDVWEIFHRKPYRCIPFSENPPE